MLTTMIHGDFKSFQSLFHLFFNKLGQRYYCVYVLGRNYMVADHEW